MIKAILFDLDGVLCELVQVHRNAFNNALQKVCGYFINEYEFWKYYNGIPSKVKLRMLVNRGILDPKDVQKVWNLKQKETVEEIKKVLKPDIEKIKIHQILKQHDFLLACVSNSIHATLDLALNVTGQLPYMDLIIGNEEFKDKPKPHPFCYIEAMRRLKIDKKETLIIEDSEKGLLAARGSGAHVLAVKNTKDVTLYKIEKTIKNIGRKKDAK